MDGQYVDLSEHIKTTLDIDLLKRTPSSFLGSCRYKLPEICDNKEVYEQIFRIGEGDVFIGISYPRYSSRTVKAMQFAKSTGATVIGLTDGPGSPFVELADINLFAKSDMVSFLDSLVAPMSLINALIVSIGIRHSESLSETFRKLEGIWSDYDVYETTPEN